MAPKFKILLYESMHPRGTGLLEEKCELVYANSLSEENLIAQAAAVDGIIIRANGAITRPIIESAPRLKVIGRHGVGLDAIDLRCAKERGVKVVYTPTANTESVAEHFVALALDLAKMIGLADAALRSGDWGARHRLIGTELRGKTLGVLGFGRIGQQTARICRNGFAMDVLYYDVCDYPAVERELQAKRVAREKVFEQSDFISVNLPLLPDTRHFVNADMLRLMKPSAFIINMARGPAWKEEDVVRALTEKWIAGAGSDVYEVEPASTDNPLFKMDNFVGTPHMSAHSEEGMIRMSMVAADVIAVLEGREPEYPVTV
jgi:D-3-phosphoglycerate dehydrogenase / 2-oxoglutarate reductase